MNLMRLNALSHEDNVCYAEEQTCTESLTGAVVFCVHLPMVMLLLLLYYYQYCRTHNTLVPLHTICLFKCHTMKLNTKNGNVGDPLE